MQKCLILIVFCLAFFPATSSADSSAFEQYFKQGNTFFREKAWDDAIDAYNRAVQINGEVAEVHFNLGLAYFYKRLELSRTSRLSEFLEKEKHPTVESLDKFIAANEAATKALLEKEVQQWKRTIQLDDTKSAAHYMLGTHYHNIGRLNEAEQELKRAIELDPKYSNSYGVLAAVYEKLGKNDLAIEYHKKDLEIDPEDEGARRDLAVLYYKLGMKKEAVEQYNKHRFSRTFKRHSNIRFVQGVHSNLNVSLAPPSQESDWGSRCQGTALRIGLWARRG